MNISQLEYLVKAIELKSFTLAGRSLFVSSQAVSKAVGDLEKELGVTFFEKSGNVIEPTPFGRFFARKAKEVLDCIGDLKKLARQQSHESIPHGDVVIAVGSSSYRGDIFPIASLEAFQVRYPFVKLKILSNSSSVCLAAVEENIANSAIVLGRAHPSCLESVKLFDLSPRVLMTRDHVLSSKKEVSVSDLVKERIALPMDLRSMYVEINSYFSRLGISPELIELEPFVSRHLEFLKEEKGIIFVSPWFEKAQEMYPECVILPLNKDEKISIPVCFVSKKNCNNSLAVMLRDYVMQWFNDGNESVDDN